METIDIHAREKNKAVFESASTFRPEDGIPDHELEVLSGRKWGRWLAAVIMAVLAVWLGWGVVTNPNFQWDVVFQYLTAHVVLSGLGLTLWLTCAAMAIGIVLGTLLAVMRTSSNPFLSVPAQLYLWFFRGTPVLVQLIFWFNLAILIPQISIAIPFGPVLFHGSANDLITPYTAALLGLGLNEGAYMAEIVRAGILSIDPGQQEAARALGMTPARILRRIVLPQAIRIIVPPAGNETIGMLKTTSLVSVIALSDLLYSVESVSSRTFQTIPLLVVACIWYLVVTSVLSLLQSRIERHLCLTRRARKAGSWMRVFGGIVR
ncbi:amino ABC transporter, permease, 3-TM region, His/Glu/Gln/Arg/opine family domain protein [Paraburkholderia xenovorans LB400]|uniref:Glutamate/aspartate import permease protein GltK n=1 Tax=Paraburkholderia xenovorans (strain LB400) TaxID=266265 RepID=Q13FW4_PARXL|nr:amino acid ABC transporter permease [Paraburkholderia xenovorans]ABE37025.1 amino acid ABC transporter membrane protein, PAAT family [Paraburkholderia xenovorans LB400]AIP34100.1 amino ABC transporter, permease, 3-TM region, His/Glu/Gln/Arg/opine family domain protein [Paraburkholderia xenovorans LB400]